MKFTPKPYFEIFEAYRIFCTFLFPFLFAINLSAEISRPPFNPAWWCSGAHAQSIAGALFRPRERNALLRERLEMPDGDFLDVDWLAGTPGSPLIIILHGLGGSAGANYVQTLVSEIQKKKWQAAAINARGSTEINRLPETSHGGQTKDLDFVVRTAIQRKKAREIYLAGYSIGGNQLLKWLGEQGPNVPNEIKGAAAVSVPYDLAKSVKNLDRGFNKAVYTRLLLKNLKAAALKKSVQFPGKLDAEKIRRAATFKEYDHEVTALLNGFQNELEYWEKSSSANFLNRIRVRTLLIHAANDSFLPEKDLPLEKIRENSDYLELLLTEDGGHAGFVSGAVPFRLDHWLEETILNFFSI